MKLLDPNFRITLQAQSACIAWCWLLERVDGVFLGFTSIDLSFEINGIIYEPFAGFTPTADSNAEGLESNDSAELAGLLESDRITAEDILAGVYHSAKLNCFLVDVANLPITLAEEPPLHLVQYRRRIKNISPTDLGFNLELRDDDYVLDTEIGKVTSKFCEHDLGDSKCGIAVPTSVETIATVISRTQFTTSGAFNVGQFDRGKIFFNTGLNAGIERDIYQFESGNLVTLWQPFPFLIALGDEVVLTNGCGKTLFDCITRYNNAVNSDSDPHIPSVDQVISTPIERD